MPKRRVPQGRPKWLGQADACLHDVRRNFMPLSWTFKTELERRGLKIDYLSGKPLRPRDLAALRSGSLRRIAKSLNAYDLLESQILAISKKKRATAQEQTAVSQKAKRMLRIARELRVGSGYLQRLVRGTEGADFYRAYLNNRHIVEANLKPLIEMKERRFEARQAVRLRPFFSEYGRRKFFDRENRAVQPKFNIGAVGMIKANKDGLITSLNNLVQDAINHNPPTPIYVNATAKQGWVSVKVFNKGPPIPAERLSLIGRKAYWSRGKGRLRGRGKISVRQFCEDHGGTLRVYNMRRSGRHFGPCLEMLLPAA